MDSAPGEGCLRATANMGYEEGEHAHMLTAIRQVVQLTVFK